MYEISDSVWLQWICEKLKYKYSFRNAQLSLVDNRKRQHCNLDFNIYFLKMIIQMHYSIIYLDELEIKTTGNKKQEKKSAFCTKSVFLKDFFAIMT